MKLVLDEDGHAVLHKTDDGRVLPTYEYEDGSKTEFDAHATLEGLNKKLSAESEEKQRHYEKAKKFEEDLEAYKDIDPDKAKEALKTVKNLSDKKLMDEKGVEAVKAEVRNDMKILAEERETALKNAHQKDREEWESKHNSQEKLINKLVVDNLFANSDFFSGDNPKTIYPADDAAKIFGHHVDLNIEDGRVNVTMKDNNGKTIISKIEHGEPATFNEGIGIIIDKHPRKSAILQAGKSGGSGGTGNLDSKGKKLKDMSSTEKIAHGLKRYKAKHGAS